MIFLFCMWMQVPLVEELKPLEFLIGEWETLSVYPDGTQAPGHLTYESVLGGAWIKFTFVGQHPTRPVWEAHGFIHATQEGFESIAIFSSQPPVHMPGHWLSDQGFFRSTNEAGDGGIDYHPEQGAVYQENWQIIDGTRTVTLRTHYRPVQ
ncbi:MAG: hypothetical protein KDC71_01500 [Acidobacteria bacterium]|nr:hypothetical protein [Acidobacteriota bacterium]